jgi:uncharacterized protein YebE (UPF0316 family)
MKANDRLLGVSILFIIFTIVFPMVLFKETSLAAILAFFALGFGCGISTGVWFARRGK